MNLDALFLPALIAARLLGRRDKDPEIFGGLGNRGVKKRNWVTAREAGDAAEPSCLCVQ